MVIYCLGVFVSSGTGRARVGHALVRRRRCVSFFGISIFWIESLFLGVGGELPGHHLLLNAVVMQIERLEFALSSHLTRIMHGARSNIFQPSQIDFAMRFTKKPGLARIGLEHNAIVD